MSVTWTRLSYSARSSSIAEQRKLILAACIYFFLSLWQKLTDTDPVTTNTGNEWRHFLKFSISTSLHPFPLSTWVELQYGLRHVNVDAHFITKLLKNANQTPRAWISTSSANNRCLCCLNRRTSDLGSVLIFSIRMSFILVETRRIRLSVTWQSWVFLSSEQECRHNSLSCQACPFPLLPGGCHSSDVISTWVALTVRKQVKAVT